MVIFRLTFMREGCYNRDMKKYKLYEGFTIIEVVLVLAIAGLIFLAVFLALPALQRSIRDKSRKDSVARTVAMIKTYRSNGGRQLKFSDEYGEYGAYYFTKNNSGEWETSGEDYAHVKEYLNGQNYPPEIERISFFSKGVSPIFVRHPRRSVYDDYVDRLRIILGSSCEMYKSSDEGEYPRYNPNKSIVAIHLEASDYYCEEV